MKAKETDVRHPKRMKERQKKSRMTKQTNGRGKKREKLN